MGKSPTQKFIIEVADVTKEYNVKTQVIKVLKGVNLKVRKSEFVMVVGHSGSGKSTILHIVMGLEPATTGQVRFMDVNMHEADADDRAIFRKQNLGIIYQQNNWIKSMNVMMNVAFPLLLQGEKKHMALNRAREALALVDMDEWAYFNPHELSSGQQQRVGLARALVTDPEVIVADEPTGNLDYQSGEKLMQLFRKLTTEKGKTILMITHDIENVDYADRILRVFDGTIVEDIQVDSKNKEEVKKSLTDSKQFQEFKQDIVKAPEVPDLEQRTRFWKSVFRTLGKSIGSFPRKLPRRMVTLVRELMSLITTFVAIVVSLVAQSISKLFSFPFFPKRIQSLQYQFSDFNVRMANRIKGRRVDSISYADMLDMSFKNMSERKSRSVVTIGGVAVSIAFTVLLVAIGFGLERLVIERVASLDQLKQIDFAAPASGTPRVNDETIADVMQISGVKEIYPEIGIAGKALLANATVDSVVYGVQSDYFTVSGINKVAGDYFDSNELTNQYLSEQEFVVGQTEAEQILQDLVDAQQSEEPVSLPVAADQPTSGTGEIVVELPEYAIKEAVVNTALLELLDVSPDAAVGQTLDLSFVATQGVWDGDAELSSLAAPFTITGVVETLTVPVAFVPIVDAKSIGIDTYSQAKVVTIGQTSVPEIRQQIEVTGFRTSSVLDTISQIESLFASVRTVFASVGFVAMIVASFGMFNTLTISLLERTREVGLMKAIGMRSVEVKDLFLTESILMGLFGGIFGVLIGLAVGYLISLILTLLSISRGAEPLQIVYLPISIAVLIVMISAVIGIITGFYPARRATKISALDALRYE